MFPGHSSTSPSALSDVFPLILHRMINRIRQSLELSEILDATVTEVRAFLQTDRVKIYRFYEDGSGEVVAEAIHDRQLPSLLGHNFPAEDIPPEARELFLKVRLRSIVDVEARQIGTSTLEDRANGEVWASDLRFRPVDPCHIDYLIEMGVKSSLVVPILDRDTLWGLLVSHHHQPRLLSKQTLQVVQVVADQVSISIAQAKTLQQSRQRAAHETTLNQVVSLLHSFPEMQLQQALEQVVTALQGSGGRLYTASQQLFVCGEQPLLKIGGSLDPTAGRIETDPDWQTWLEMEEALESGGWAIADLQRSMMPSELAIAFFAANVRSLLVIPLQYRQETLGYLSIFRPAIDLERIWAGRLDDRDPRQLRPRRSFETWQELKHEQAQPWATADIELAQTLGRHFAMAIHQRGLYHQVRDLNAHLKRDIQKQQQAERRISALNAQLEQRVSERTRELQQANADLLREIAQRECVLQERQRAEASLARLSHQNELILNAAGDGIYGLDSQGNISFVNAAAAKMLGFEVNELIGQWMHTRLNYSQPDGTPYLAAESPIYATLRDGTVQDKTGDLFQRCDGSTFPVEYVSSPIREQAQIVGAVIVFRDITDRQIIEQMKDEFVSIVSHELRTPLTSIRSTLGLLSSGWLDHYPEKSRRMLEIAFSNTNRLVRLISDILDIERIKFGKVTAEKKLCNAADIMTQSGDAMRAMAEKAGIHLSVTPVSVELYADPDRLIQTLTNLINNAIKFSPAGSTVSLTATLKPEKNSRRKSAAKSRSDQILFCVKDEGMGIPEDKLETIFDRFQQIDASNSRSQAGTGLGLTICRGIVEQYNGKIWAESQLGQGSTFYVTLPLTPHLP